MSKNRNYAEVNTSYTTFFLVSTVAFGIFFGNLLPEAKHASALTVTLYALLLYFVWDFIKQLYSPGQAVFLYVMIFLIMPFAINWLLDFPYARLGSIVLICSSIVAGILELTYEIVVKKRLHNNLLARIISVDNAIDKSIVKISNDHVYVTEYKGLIFAFSLAAAYFTLTYLLLHR